MAKAVADVNDPEEKQGGFASTGDITGFSHMHDSGTGGVGWSLFQRISY
jgi:putative alpha-1,2-mannosidase